MTKQQTAPSFITPVATPEDKLDQVRAKLAETRDTILELRNLEELSSRAHKKLNSLVSNELPALFDEAQISGLDLNADGNLPAYECKLKPFYSANIAADWEPDKRSEAFKYITSLGEEDLIKTDVVVSFPREQRAAANKLVAELNKRDIPAMVIERIHAQTLTAWLKRQVENKHFVPDLDIIGGTVGRVVKMKEKKE